MSTPNNTMSYGRIQGLDKPVSRVVYGTLFLHQVDKPYELLDAIRDTGCNTFDCAAIYGKGLCESVLGDWLRDRKVPRNELVICTKGGCGDETTQWAPSLAPDALRAELEGSLDRLRLEHVDVYMLHRDDTKLPVAEIVNTMNAFVTEGKVSTWGVSNWTTERLAQAITYARANGCAAPVCDSVQASLAQPEQAVWPGTQFMDSSRSQWCADRNIAVFAWECLAKGFLAGRWASDVQVSDLQEHRAKRAKAEHGSNEWRQAQLDRAYLTEVNVHRRDRVLELAEKKAMPASSVALAWVLAQEYNAFVLVGTTKMEHFECNAKAAAVRLTAAEAEYLNSGLWHTKSGHKGSEEPLVTPMALAQTLPASAQVMQTVSMGRSRLAALMDDHDDRLMVLVGPCSIHDPVAAMDYAARLKPFADKHQGELVVVMRVYFEKPRTTVGWKGLISDPDLDGSFNMGKGLRVARRLMLQVNDMGLPVGTEYLNPLTARYISDLVAYGAIGARTTESQMHREMAATMNMPVGFKNGTTGDIQVAVDAIGAAKSKTSFLGNDMNGCPSIIHAQGNPHSHMILRGGSKGTNFDRESIAACEAKMKGSPAIVVDCSHGNSKKLHTNQPLVADDIAAQIVDGNRSIKGVMIESNIVAGAQKLNPGKTPVEDLKYGLSVTDACIDMEDTAKTLDVLAAAVAKRRATAAAEATKVTGIADVMATSMPVAAFT